MYPAIYNENLEDYDCDCSSYILFNEDGKKLQKVYHMTGQSFERSPIYLYWGNLSIKKVEFTMDGSFIYTFNGTGTNATSFYRNEKFISMKPNKNTKKKFTSNNDITTPYFYMDFGNDFNYGNWIEAKMVNGYYKLIMYYNDGYSNHDH
ncbi:uncharacterized protein LOC118764388 [Octopus sinensis]|uniref:Uncharacterized protein LOC118764388 n=1 Tax=Octopus sinensis TaxID=2607531 RepID=A0A7E6F1A3_9MOLL|nr:uncharacterized protein LOC118764388 [Octopus sinensis]